MISTHTMHKMTGLCEDLKQDSIEVEIPNETDSNEETEHTSDSSSQNGTYTYVHCIRSYIFLLYVYDKLSHSYKPYQYKYNRH